MSMSPTFLGICLWVDPSVAIVRDGKVLAFAEEERFLRNKHAKNWYPSRALKYCLEEAGVTLDQIAGVAIPWDLPAYTNGDIQQFYDQLNKNDDPDANTLAWQKKTIGLYSSDRYTSEHEQQWRRLFGDIKLPPIVPMPHHYAHAYQAYRQSSFDQALSITFDGSGDQHCTTVWKCSFDSAQDDTSMEMIYHVDIPHSLGWFYAAFTEWLGFDAYDGEYKVMGLAAYGKENLELREKIDQVLQVAEDGIGYFLNPQYVHRGEHTYSGRFSDSLSELLGKPPRADNQELGEWHRDLAFEVQYALERAAIRLVEWAIGETGISNICISGGVGQNVKLNSKLFLHDQVTDVFAHPLCGDSGQAAGAALALCEQETGSKPEKLITLALGNEESNETIEEALKRAKIDYEKPDDICSAVAKELADGKIVGWFQGRMEAGPRALGQRSILADPRSVENRDKVNAVIKYREFWRPFCPSVTAEDMDRYFDKYTYAPFMIIAFPANDLMAKEAPAVVHVDGTVRVQMVEKDVLPKYHQLIKEFEKLSGVPVLLDTSFNVKGEPMVCTVNDALRTFFATGLDVLAVGDFLVKKPKS